MSVAREPAPILVACGLKAEARIAAGPDVVVIAGGGDARRLESALREAAFQARGVLSFGIAGGLEPLLAAGSCRVARGVVGPDGARYPAHSAWAEALAAALGVPTAWFAGVDAPLATVSDKQAARENTGAALVDMETHVVARVARETRRPFAAIRVVADPAERRLPHAATVGMRPDGRVDIASVLWSLARDPRQVPDLIRTARDGRAAFAALLRGRQALDAGGGFGLLDLGEPFFDMA